jgi:hypothetical protein
METQSTRESVPLDAAAFVRRLWFVVDARDWSALRGMLDDAFVAELPVSGERFVGPDAFVEMNRQYRGGWALTLIRVVADGDRAASEIRFRSHGKTETALSFYELRDGKLVWAADWWPEPYPAPASRAHLASPPAGPDPRFVWLDLVDDARCTLLDALAPPPPEDGIGKAGERDVIPIEILLRTAASDDAATATVRALAAGEPLLGWPGNADHAEWATGGGQRGSLDGEAGAAFFRARAVLRLALWQARLDAWEQAPVLAAGGDRLSFPNICQLLADTDYALAAHLKDTLGAR